LDVMNHPKWNLIFDYSTAVDHSNTMSLYQTRAQSTIGCLIENRVGKGRLTTKEYGGNHS
jgi:hypothetical protein